MGIAHRFLLEIDLDVFGSDYQLGKVPNGFLVWIAPNIGADSVRSVSLPFYRNRPVALG